MRKLLLLVVMSLTCFIARADDFRFLAFQTQDGTLQTMPTEGLRITFAENELVATDGSRTLRLPLTELTKMFFSDDASTGIESLPDALCDDEGVVYNVQGIRVGTISKEGKYPKDLPQGIYIVKRGSKTEKISIR